MSQTSYSDHSKEELIKVVQKLEKENKQRKKYGLVWEDHPEELAERCKDELPVLKEIKEKEIITDSDKLFNTFIEGDNYHALWTLSYTHRKKIDVIYIDPPYNTGNKTWMYNNDYVEKDDSYRHSKWLSFMYKRLKLAKDLLKPKGILICTIDENEQNRLGLLLEDIFPNHEIVCVTVVHNPRGVQGKNFSYVNEYAFFVYPKDKKYITNIKRENVLIEELRDHGGKSLRTDARNCFYPIISDGTNIIKIGEVLPDDFHPEGKNILREDGLIEIYPIDKNNKERKWVFARDSVTAILDKLFVKKREDGLFDIFREKDESRPKTVWYGPKYDASTYGSKVVNNIVETNFPFPKSLYTVKDCLEASCKNNTNAVILDFFAGSGTTGHAVLELNRQDGGDRQFILCTNNENNNGNGSGGIAESVCYPRIKKVIEGYVGMKDKKQYPALGGNLKYFKTDFVPDVKTDEHKRILVARSTELLCLAEETFDKIWEEISAKEIKFALFENSKKVTAIIYDELFIETCKKEIAKQAKRVIIYVFSYTKDYNENDFSEFLFNKQIKIKPIPEAILNIYRKIPKRK